MQLLQVVSPFISGGISKKNQAADVAIVEEWVQVIHSARLPVAVLPHSGPPVTQSEQLSLFHHFVSDIQVFSMAKGAPYELCISFI